MNKTQKSLLSLKLSCNLSIRIPPNMASRSDGIRWSACTSPWSSMLPRASGCSWPGCSLSLLVSFPEQPVSSTLGRAFPLSLAGTAISWSHHLPSSVLVHDLIPGELVFYTFLREKAPGEKIFAASHLWESIFLLPSHLKDKLAECKILGLTLSGGFCRVVFGVIFEGASGISHPDAACEPSGSRGGLFSVF